MWAIIGGSGFESFSEVESLADIPRATPFGEAASGLRKIRVQTESGPIDAIFLSRHGAQHELLPSEINYAANIFALKRAGATKIIAFSAVGSLREELRPGDMVIPHQYVDRTKGIRRTSFCGGGVVGHVSLADPIWQDAAAWVDGIRPELSFSVHLNKTYVCIEGPTFSTRAESHTYRQIQADIIGMTGFPEFALAREAGLGYLPCAFVTDYDSWNEAIPHVTLEQVIELMRQNNGRALQLLKKLLASGLERDERAVQGGLNHNLLTSPEKLPLASREWMAILRGN